MSDKKFRTRRACRCVCSPGLSCALGLSDAAREQAAGRGRAPPLPAAAKSSTLAFYQRCVCVCARE